MLNIHMIDAEKSNSNVLTTRQPQNRSNFVMISNNFDAIFLILSFFSHTREQINLSIAILNVIFCGIWISQSKNLGKKSHYGLLRSLK